MTKKKPKADDDYYEPVYIVGVGAYQRTTDKRQKVKDKRIVGFVRPKKK
jgi:hypothetical protein